MITLRQLEFALAVAKHKHFKRAAEECNISQSALSLGVAELEKQLDTLIFERNNKQVLITPIGAQIIERAKRVFSEMHDLHTLAHACNTPLGYPMTIGVIPTIAPYLLPIVMPTLREQYPDFRLSIQELQTERLLEKVRYGQIDTAIIALPYNVEGLHNFEFWSENFCAVFHNSDEYAKLEQIDADTLAKTNLMLLGEGHCLTDQALNVCHLNPQDRHNTFSEASLNTLIQMALNKVGTTLVPQMAVPQICQQNSEVRAIPLAEAGPHRHIAFITRLNYARVDDVNLLGTLFREALQRNLDQQDA